MSTREQRGYQMFPVLDGTRVETALRFANAGSLDDEAHDIAAQAWAAWEAAVCWDDEHAVKRLADVRAV